MIDHDPSPDQASTTAAMLPRWDTAALRTRLAAIDLDQVLTAFAFQIDAIEQDCRRPTVPLATVINALNHTLAALEQLEADALCVLTADAQHDRARRLYQAMVQEQQRISALITQVARTIDDEDLLAPDPDPQVAAHLPIFQYLVTQRQQRLPVEMEALVAALRPSGSDAWIDVYGRIVSGLTIDVAGDDVVETLPLSASSRIAADPNRARRQRAYAAEQAVWEQHALPLVAALNAIKGEALTLARFRGWSSPLDSALADHRIDAETLTVMLESVRSLRPDFQRYLRAKASLLGLSHLAWYDLSAPIGHADTWWSFADAQRCILESFDAVFPPLGQLARRAFAGGWIDAEPRVGKHPGGLMLPAAGGAARISVTFDGSPNAVRQLAHELGHAYQYWVLTRDRRTPLQQRWIPWTLAEAASIFSETIVRGEQLKRSRADARLSTLEHVLQQLRRMLDHDAMFQVETTLFERGASCELSADEVRTCMLEAQREVYGDSLDPDHLHPYFWAVHPHAFSVEHPFSNVPYLFGLLFSIGLVTIVERDPAGFPERFDTLLSNAGMDDVPTSAADIGIDLRSSGFWDQSVQRIRRDIDAYVAAAQAGRS